MKIAVYTIACNEEKHVERWAASNVDADVRLIADTGSTDSTVELAKKNNVTVIPVNVRPFRFDVARNTALSLLPADVDVCVIQDMDEILEPGFIQTIRDNWSEETHRGWIKLNTGVDWDSDRVHARNGYRWVFPCHERCVKYDGQETSVVLNARMLHRPDNSKSRGQYLGLLEMMTREDPSNPRGWFYLGREYFYKNMKQETVSALTQYVSMSKYPSECSAAYRMLATVDEDNAESHVIQAIVCDERRESLAQAALLFYRKEDWVKCYKYAKRAVDASSPSDHFQETWATDGLVFDLIAISAYRLGKYEEALLFGDKAWKASPDDERLITNMKYYQEKVDGNIQ